ncbi:hypothetical protein [Shimazuella alba]|uniref:Uncharacterized protein n=1 Tax=Shimazuella alba TaxID=2690964 RepID=A0A6I4VVV7_9BACL|nr:hypothetical protein [Shimazuella alba]MXQ53990.1 hypothetical protein [Shimazuella alba]
MSNWKLGIPEVVWPENEAHVHYAGNYGALRSHEQVRIVIEPEGNPFKWEKSIIRCTGMYVSLSHYVSDREEQYVSFTLHAGQTFSLKEGDTFFQIITNGKEDQFDFFCRHKVFVPGREKLKSLVKQIESEHIC